jgi:hypothetical protein
MGFLKNFLKSNYRDGDVPRGTSSFRALSEEQLDAHMNIARYGDLRFQMRCDLHTTST